MLIAAGDSADFLLLFFAAFFAGLGASGVRWLWGLAWLEFDLGADDGEEGVGTGAFWKGEEGGDDLVYGVGFDDAAAVKAGDGAAAGVEEAEVVVDFGCRCDC